MILELLESRLHLSVSGADGVAWVAGTSGDDVIKVRGAGDLASTTVWVVVNGAKETIARYPFEELPSRVVVESAAGRDTVIVELHIITATIEVVVRAGRDDDGVRIVGTQPVSAFGGRGDDRLISDQYAVGSQFLKGGDGNDTLVSGEGRDTLLGGSGNDELKGGGGVDRLFGGAGHDVMHVSKKEKHDARNGEDEVVR